MNSRKDAKIQRFLPAPCTMLLAPFIAFLLVISNHSSPLHSSPAWMQKVDPLVWETATPTALSAGVSDHTTEFILYLTTQADLSAADSLPNKLAKGQFVYEKLTAVAQETQPAIVAQLDALDVNYRRFWVANMIWVEGDAAVVTALAQRTDVARLYANPRVQLDVAVETPALSAVEGTVSPNSVTDVQSIEWNVTHIGADDVWALGTTGAGVVIGGQDTGYDWTHSGLINQYRGWNGSTADHDYNWHDAIHASAPPNGNNSCGYDLAIPCDDQYHGTHTMGTMVGNDLPQTDFYWPHAAANAVGVAPGAKWIGCRNMEEGVGTPVTYAECYQWFIAPYPHGGDSMTDGDPAQAPHVINNSWGCPPGEGCTDPNVLLSVVDAVRAAGIVTVHSAGNYGSSTCGTIRDPAAIYDSSFTVGSTNGSDIISGFSSIGPVTVDGSNRFKPDIVAPGEAIRSTIPGSGYGISQGTSMAGPHVAGLVALLISYQPSLAGDVDAIETIVRETAVSFTTTKICSDDTLTSVPNHVYGNGRIDALAAIISLFPERYYFPFVQYP